MGIIVNLYKKNFLIRYDKDPAIPYFSVDDFINLQHEEGSFVNSKGIKICYFVYYYKNFSKQGNILFCHGLGPGHTAYFAEIDALCKKGYKVLTLDYAGCGESGGERITSVNEPAQNVIELINHLNIQKDLILIGHSLGGYTALTVINKVNFIHKAVIISGFVDIASEMLGFFKFKSLANKVQKYEKKLNPDFADFDNWSYLKDTSDELLFIHSIDDTMVSYKYNTQRVIAFNNPQIKSYICDKKKHNPNYSLEATEYMNQTMGTYYALVKKGNLKTLEERKAYFADKSIERMTEQDKEVIDIICNFLEK